MPRKIAAVPMVTMIGEILSTRTSVPLSSPNSAPKPNPINTVSSGFCVNTAARATTTEVSAYWPPIERSTLPEMSKKPLPIAAIAIDEMLSKVAKALSIVKKLS